MHKSIQCEFSMLILFQRIMEWFVDWRIFVQEPELNEPSMNDINLRKKKIKLLFSFQLNELTWKKE